MILMINTASVLKGGGIQVAKSFIEECINHTEHEYHVVLSPTIAPLIDESEYPDNFCFYRIDYRPATRVFTFKSHDEFFKQIEKKVKPDCVFTTSGPSYWRPKAKHIMGFNIAHYIYPESPFLSSLSIYRRVRWILKALIAKYFFRRDGDCFVVQTDDVNLRLRKWLSTSEVYTVTNSYGSHFNHSTKDVRMLPKKEGNEYRLLMLCAYYPHKNFEIINKVAELLHSRDINNIKFVLTLADGILREIFSPHALSRIYNVGPVKPEGCPGLYQETDFVFSPTLLECFSANYVEAMFMKKPIITSDLGFARTVCGNAALYFDPLSAEDILDKILLLTNSREIQKEMIREGIKKLETFNDSKKRAQMYLSICEQD